MNHEARLKEFAARFPYLDAGTETAVRDAVSAGAEALRIAREGVPRYLQNGGCSNCGAIPHTATCMVGQFVALLGGDEP